MNFVRVVEHIMILNILFIPDIAISTVLCPCKHYVMESDFYFENF